MRSPENSRGKKGPEHGIREILDEDKYISSLVSKVNGLKESDSDSYVRFVARDASIVAGVFDRLAVDSNYRPSTEQLKSDSRLEEVWRSLKNMRDAITGSQSSDQVKRAYYSIIDGLVSGAAEAVSSRASRDAGTRPETVAGRGNDDEVTPVAQAPRTPGGDAGGSPDIKAAPPVPGGDAGGSPASPDVRTAPRTPDNDAGTGGEGLQQMLARKDELLNEILALAINGGDQDEIKRLGLELADLVKRMTSGSETSATRSAPPPAPQPTSRTSTRGARQTRPSPQPQPGTQSGGTPGGSGGGPGSPGTPPPTQPQPGGPTGSEPGRPRPAPRTPDHDAGQPKTLEQEERELEERLAKIREERNAPYAAKLDAYAELLAKEESKRADGGFRFSIMHWVGGPGNNRKRERRREALDEAGKALKKEVLAYLRQKVETKRQKGEYQGTDDEIAQQMSDEMFDEQRRIFGQRLQERKDEILRSESDKLRNRILAKIGSWIGMEKSTKNSLKAAAVGVGHGLVKGAAVGALTGLFGVTWPISVGVSIVAAAVGDRMVRRGIRLDAIRQGLGGQNGSRQLVDDDKFARIKEKAEGKKRSQEFMADKMLKLSRKDSYAAGDRLSKETNERLNKHKVALGIGRLAGGAVGGIGGRWVGQQLHDHTPVGQAVDRARRNVHEFIHREDTAAAAAEREYQGKIDELNRRIDELNNRLERAAAGNIDNSGSFSNWEYPWDWAVDQFGENNAISKLYELADAAARDGHNIQWHGYGDTQWLSIDGKSDTQSVLEILNKYNYGLAA